MKHIYRTEIKISKKNNNRKSINTFKMRIGAALECAQTLKNREFFKFTTKRVS